MAEQAKVTTAFDPSDLERIRKVARGDGLPPSTFLRMLALREVKARENASHPVAA